AVAAPRYVGDVALAVAAVAERLAQCRDMDPQGALLDDRVGPGARDQFVLADRLAGAFGQRDQDVQRPAAERQWLFAVEQQPLLREQPERSEDEGRATHREIVLRGP